jgi:hypothetical protein
LPSTSLGFGTGAKSNTGLGLGVGPGYGRGAGHAPLWGLLIEIRLILNKFNEAGELSVNQTHY